MAQGRAIAATRPVPVADGGPLPPGGKPVPPAGGGVPAPADISRAVEVIERFIRESARSLSFDYDEVTGRSIVRVRDAATGDILRQFPSEEALAVARRLAETARATGFLDLRA